ncbi:hypothetical protein [Nocardia sp. NBC_00403]|uniref:hypothetical protein n=1 Tax=Nocardia sp. NBC_00403 TaxID=2975990 RepID=UPI002E1C093C
MSGAHFGADAAFVTVCRTPVGPSSTTPAGSVGVWTRYERDALGKLCTVDRSGRVYYDDGRDAVWLGLLGSSKTATWAASRPLNQRLKHAIGGIIVR